MSQNIHDESGFKVTICRETDFIAIESKTLRWGNYDLPPPRVETTSLKPLAWERKLSQYSSWSTLSAISSSYFISCYHSTQLSIGYCELDIIWWHRLSPGAETKATGGGRRPKGLQPAHWDQYILYNIVQSRPILYNIDPSQIYCTITYESKTSLL